MHAIDWLRSDCETDRPLINRFQIIKKINIQDIDQRMLQDSNSSGSLPEVNRTK